MSEQQQSQEQLALVKQALLEHVFKLYHELVGNLRKLPIQQALPLLQKAYMDIDTGMVLVKEIVNSAPLVFPRPKPASTQAPEGLESKEEKTLATNEQCTENPNPAIEEKPAE